ncbi:MAG: Holliday junction branch migration protein RuvA [Cyanobacteriota bacterium]
MEASPGWPMIGWLQGELFDPWQQQANRFGILLVCQGVGYEVQLCQRQWLRLPPPGSRLTLHVHQSIREDGWTLFGFESREERDLFRELVAVSGVGPQMGMALLGAMEVEELVRAVVEGDGRRLSQAPGVGKRTAERLCLELRQKFQQRLGDGGQGAPSSAGVEGGGSAPLGEGAQASELRSLLAAMGYENGEIQAALKAVAAQGVGPEADLERWLGDCLRWLSRTAA